MRRREFLCGLSAGLAAWPNSALTQQALRRIGVLTQGSITSHPTAGFRIFLKALQDAGWDEGRNLKIEWRFSEGGAEPLPRLAAQLVELPVEVIVTTPTEPTLAAKRATSTIPIVFVQVANPLQAGIVTNLARPDGNVTGMSSLATDIAGKRLALIKEALPHTKSIDVLWNRPSKGSAMILEEFRVAGKQLDLELRDIGIDSAVEIEPALRKAAIARSSVVAVLDDPVMQGHVATVTRIAEELRLPLAAQSAVYPKNGGLMSYGPDPDEIFRRVAEYVSRILKGAKPADLPVQQPEKFQLVLNLRTARALGISFPPTFLARADEVIE